MFRAVAVVAIATRIDGVRHTVLPGAPLPADMAPAEVDEMLALGAARLEAVAEHVAQAYPQGVGRGCNAAETPAATTTLSLPAGSSDCLSETPSPAPAPKAGKMPALQTPGKAAKPK